MKLNELRDNQGATKNRIRVGRGIGSGKGKTCGRGQKGQKSRSGVAVKGFEGGQMPIYRRLPKRGFKNPHRIEFAVVNLVDLEHTFNANDEVTYEKMVETGLVKNFKFPVKVLARGEITKPLTVHAHHFSAAAKEMIEKVGGKAVEVI